MGLIAFTFYSALHKVHNFFQVGKSTIKSSSHFLAFLRYHSVKSLWNMIVPVSLVWVQVGVCWRGDTAGLWLRAEEMMNEQLSITWRGWLLPLLVSLPGVPLLAGWPLTHSLPG